MEKFKLLIENIKHSDLSQIDKETLIKILEEDEVDINFFIKTFLSILKISKEILKLFDIDIGDS